MNQRPRALGALVAFLAFLLPDVQWARRLAWRAGISVLLAHLLLQLEGLRTVRVAGTELVGPWETVLVARGAPALALAMIAPAFLVVGFFAALVPIVTRRPGRLAWAGAAAIVAGTLAVDLSTGRKAHVLAVRAPFVVGFALVAALVAYFVLPRVHRLAQRSALVLPVLGVFLGAAAIVADARVLPRLYPPFHLACMGLVVIAVMMIADGLLALARLHRFAPLAVDALALYGAWQVNVAGGRLKWAGEGLARFDNARRVLDERSAWLGRASELATRWWPPAPLELGESGNDPLLEDGARSLDAQGRDVLLVTIDALRADHVGAYGYARSTTPAIDALAAEGVLFEHAYTPTPHTSYAVASLMTGKYMRPILALEAIAGGARRPDETWALLLRNYGFRTAAFYPPAVFFVDGERFADLAGRGLDFEYHKIEFAAPELRAKQLRAWLDGAPKDKPLFAWVHLFEPHEPYVMHDAHAFSGGDEEINRYDSEIAAADDGVRALVAAFRAARPSAMVIVTADHGEAFGEHGARYHGTTVYEEQVRVPLVVSAPGLVAAGRRVDRPVQLVDLLPTVLSAYGMPRPPRVRGRDLGALLAITEPTVGDGVAFSEVDEAKMFAKGSRRLICNQRTATCALYDVAADPKEERAIVTADAELMSMRKAMGALIAGSARLEGFSAGANAWPDALRRAFEGEGEAAIEVTALLDDVDVEFRRRAAEALARLGRAETAVHVARALVHEDDALTLQWLHVARVRTLRADEGAPFSEDTERAVIALLDQGASLRRYAALALAEGEARGTLSLTSAVAIRASTVLAEWLPAAREDAELARAVVEGLVTLRPKAGPAVAKLATTPLLAALSDVRLRAVAARALGLLGDPGAAAGLVAQVSNERHLEARAGEALALARVGERERALTFFASMLGVPVAAPSGVEALAAALPTGVGASFLVRPVAGATKGHFTLGVMKGERHRLLVGAAVGRALRARLVVGATPGPWITATAGEAGAIFELDDQLGQRKVISAVVDVEALDGQPIGLVVLVPRVDDLPPPKPDRDVDDPEAPEAPEMPGKNEKVPTDGGP